MALLYLALSTGGGYGGISDPFNLYFCIDFFICLFSVCLLVDRRLKVSFSSGITYLMPNFLNRLWRVFSCSEKEFAPTRFFYVLLKIVMLWFFAICIGRWVFICLSFPRRVLLLQDLMISVSGFFIFWQFYFVLNLYNIGMFSG